jgi:hypothetical protein
MNRQLLNKIISQMSLFLNKGDPIGDLKVGALLAGKGQF